MRRAATLTLALAALLVLGVLALTYLNRDGAGPAVEPPSSGGPQSAGAPADRPLAGLNLTAYTRDGYGRPEVRADIERITGLGASAVTLTPTWYMKAGNSDVIRPDREKSPSDASLDRVIGWIRAAGLKLVLKPHVDVLDGTFRGEIQPADRNRWFRSYQAFIDHYATIAAESGAEVFTVGTELKSLSGDPAPWRSLIDRVRTLFSGSLTYAANWDEFQQVQFWDGLDLIGVDAYFPLAAGNPDPDPAALAAAWAPILDSLGASSGQWGRPILVTEVGYPSQASATEHPWEVTPDGAADPELQARAYQAVFDAFRDRSWLAGINWWSWRADPSAEENPDTDYTPEYKPAEQILGREWPAG